MKRRSAFGRAFLIFFALALAIQPSTAVVGQFGFLCVPLRLGGEFSLKTAEPQRRRERRDSQRVETDPLPSTAVMGQSSKPHEGERELQIQTGLQLLREVVLKEAGDLRLVENRVYVYRSAAATLAKKTAEESAQLLERAITEIDTQLTPVGDAPQPYPVEQLRRVRDEVVLALAELDPLRALRAIHGNKNYGRRTPADKDLELRVLEKSVATNPSLVLESGLKSLRGTLSPSVVQTYIALREKNPEMGRQLGGAIVERLRGESPEPHSPAAQTAFALLADIWSRGTETTLDSTLLDDSSIRHLVTFVTDLALAQQSLPGGFTGDLTSFAILVEKYAPAKTAPLRRILAKLPAQQLPFGPPDMKELEAFLQSQNYDRAADWTRNAPVEAKRYALQRIAEAQSTAEKDDAATTKELSPLLYSGPERLSTLLLLARKALESGDKEKAGAILEEARALPFDKSEQLLNELLVAETYFKVDRAKAVEIVGANIERFNALLEAAAVLDGYFAPECFREGEFSYLSQSPLLPGVVALSDVLAKIAALDSEQAVQLARRIAGRELQTFALMNIASRLILGPDYRQNEIGPFLHTSSSQQLFTKDSLIRAGMKGRDYEVM